MDETPTHDMFDGLRDAKTRAFIVGRAVATVGTQFVSVAVSWALYVRTGSPWVLGLVGLFEVVQSWR
jgi:hypothetical protein